MGNVRKDWDDRGANQGGFVHAIRVFLKCESGLCRNTKGGLAAALIADCTCEAVLDALDVFCLPALGAFDHVKLHLLTFLEAAESAGLDGGEMYEDILTILAADKSIALGVVKPLHCSCFHVVALFLFF